MSSLTSLPQDLFYTFCFPSRDCESDHEMAHQAFKTAVALKLTSQRLFQIISGAFFCQEFFSAIKPDYLFAGLYSHLKNPTWESLIEKYTVINNWICQTPSILPEKEFVIPQPNFVMGNDLGLFAIKFNSDNLSCYSLNEALHVKYNLPKELFQYRLNYCQDLEPIMLNNYFVFNLDELESVFLFSPDKGWIGPFKCEGAPLGIKNDRLLISGNAELLIYDIQNPKEAPKVWKKTNLQSIYCTGTLIFEKVRSAEGKFSYFVMEVAKLVDALDRDEEPTWHMIGDYSENAHQCFIHRQDLYSTIFRYTGKIGLHGLEFKENKLSIRFLGELESVPNASKLYGGRIFLPSKNLENQMIETSTCQFLKKLGKERCYNYAFSWHRSSYSKIHHVWKSNYSNFFYVETFDYAKDLQG